MHIVAFLSIVNNNVIVQSRYMGIYIMITIFNELPFDVSSWIISYFVIIKVFNIYHAYQKIVLLECVARKTINKQAKNLIYLDLV